MQEMLKMKRFEEVEWLYVRRTMEGGKVKEFSEAAWSFIALGRIGKGKSTSSWESGRQSELYVDIKKS